MKRNLLRAVSAVTVLASLFFLSATASSATPEGADIAPEARIALERVTETGILSEADRETLLRHPDIAAMLVDPRPTAVETGGTTTRDVASEKEFGASACWISEWFIDGFTVLGSHAYRWHHRADWCENGSSVTSVHYRNGWATQLATFFYYRGIANDTVTPIPSFEVQSTMQGLIENCHPLGGCTNMNHPWVKHILRANLTGWSERGH
ncbi:hypothetical protein [Actinophytocola glycyrrhizae]|uniref:Uncharacterized protein n=1 Tax=Actinophytocola glycyrrhizae TaxID=2044873 RepID=A0ABV9RY08_9PSEU